MPPASRGRGIMGGMLSFSGSGLGRGRGAGGAGGRGTGGGRRWSITSVLLSVLGVMVAGAVWLSWPAQRGRGGHGADAVGPYEAGAGARARPGFGQSMAQGKSGGYGVPARNRRDDTSPAAASAGQGSPGYPRSVDDIHVVFSTDCKGYQRWQAVVLFHSAVVSGHAGPITQLVSGCTDKQKVETTARHELSKHTVDHKLYFTPSFSTKNPQTGEAYPYMNKPNAMMLWLNETEPLTTYLNPSETVVRGDGLSIEGLKLEKGGWVREGHPSGQRFGLPNWTRWNREKICPKDSVCLTASTAMWALDRDQMTTGVGRVEVTVKRFWDLIPPYLAHKNDWKRILPEWVRQAPKVYEQYPSLLAEQTAYATAAASLNLRHYRINNYAIESEKVDYEPWDAVDHNIGNVCDVGIEDGDGMSVSLRSFERIPYFIHYCHMYRVGHWLFNKRRYRKDQEYDQLLCETPLLAEPPTDTQQNAFKMHPGARYEAITPRAAKRNAFVLCVGTRFVNSALRRYKTLACRDGTANFEQTVRIS